MIKAVAFEYSLWDGNKTLRNVALQNVCRTFSYVMSSGPHYNPVSCKGLITPIVEMRRLKT